MFILYENQQSAIFEIYISVKGSRFVQLETGGLWCAEFQEIK